MKLLRKIGDDWFIKQKDGSYRDFYSWLRSNTFFIILPFVMLCLLLRMLSLI